MARDPTPPTPAFDWETRFYWEGCARGELWLQRCADTLPFFVMLPPHAFSYRTS